MVCIMAGWLNIGILLAMGVEPGQQQFEKLLDFGEIPRNAAIIHKSVQIRNDTGLGMKLRCVGCSCGCITSATYDDDIPPGGEGKISLAFDPSKVGPGPGLQTVYFDTGNPARPTLNIKVCYIVRGSDVRISPSFIDTTLSWDELRQTSGKYVRTIIVADMCKNRLDVSDIKTSANLICGYYDILYRCPSGTATHIFRLDLYLRAMSRPGLYDEWVSFKTNHPEYPEVVVPVRIRALLEAVQVSPRLIVLHRGSQKEGLVGRARIYSKDASASLDVHIAACRDKWLECEVKRVSRNAFDLVVTCDRSQLEAEKGQVLRSAVELEVGTTDPAEERVEIVVLPDLKDVTSR